MSNWLRQTKRKPRAKGKQEHDFTTAINRTMFIQAQSYLGRRKQMYKSRIVPCAKCKRLFRINRTLNEVCDHKSFKKLCPNCRGIVSENYKYVSDKEKEAIKNLHKAVGCTKRQMTPEERIKYGLDPL